MTPAPYTPILDPQPTHHPVSAGSDLTISFPREDKRFNEILDGRRHDGSILMYIVFGSETSLKNDCMI